MKYQRKLVGAASCRDRATEIQRVVAAAKYRSRTASTQKRGHTCVNSVSRRPIQWISLLLLVLFGLISGCSSPEVIVDRHIVALGTVVSITAHDPPTTFDSVIEEVITPALRQMEQDWRSFGEGELGVANDRLEQGRCATVSKLTKELIDRAIAYRSVSLGFFDPTLGITVDQWGFRDSEQSPAVPASRKLPGDQDTLRRIGNTGAQIHWQLESSSETLNEWSMCSNIPVRIDLGGIAKGYIVAELAKILARHEIQNALVSAGGDVMVLGTKGNTAWRIAIQHPRAPQVIATLEAYPGEAIFSSGDYHRYKIIDGKRIHHLIDPTTRAPANHSIAVTVIHNNALLADAAATALFVAGPQRFEEVAEAMNISRAMLIDQNMKIHTLPHWSTPLPDNLR